MRSSKALTDEYNMLVDMLDDQIARLEKVDPESIALDRYRNAFYKIDEDMNYQTVKRMRDELKRIVESDQLSPSAQERAKANALETLHREGYEYVNKRNFNSFMRFLDDARARGLAQMYSSEQILDAVNKAKKKGLTKSQIIKNMDYWAKKSTDRQGRVIEVENPKPLDLSRKRRK